MLAGQNSPHFCTVEKLGPTEGPNISTVFILNENMVGHNEVPIIPMVPTFRCTQIPKYDNILVLSSYFWAPDQ